MSKLGLSAYPSKALGIAILTIQGVLAAIVVSFIAICLLALSCSFAEYISLDRYLQYIMVGISMISIFVGSVFATRKAKSMGLIIGVLVGILYVLISICIGLNLTEDAASPLLLVSKLMAGIAAGALGGFIGVNLGN